MLDTGKNKDRNQGTVLLMRHPLILGLLSCFAGFAISAHAQRSATSPEQIRLPDGFKIELLYSVPRSDQGSWVAMCQDDKGRLIVSDQHGGLYRFPIPKLGERVDPASIQQITGLTAITPPTIRQTSPIILPCSLDMNWKILWQMSDVAGEFFSNGFIGPGQSRSVFAALR